MPKGKGKYKDRKCGVCENDYTPKGARGSTCPDCRGKRKGTDGAKPAGKKPRKPAAAAQKKSEDLAGRLRDLVEDVVEKRLQVFDAQIDKLVEATVQAELNKLVPGK